MKFSEKWPNFMKFHENSWNFITLGTLKVNNWHPHLTQQLFQSNKQQGEKLHKRQKHTCDCEEQNNSLAQLIKIKQRSSFNASTKEKTAEVHPVWASLLQQKTAVNGKIRLQFLKIRVRSHRNRHINVATTMLKITVKLSIANDLHWWRWKEETVLPI